MSGCEPHPPRERDHGTSRRDLLRATALIGTASAFGVADLGARTRVAAADTGTTPPRRLSATVSTKRGSTYYTPAKVAAARRNVATYDWARQLRDDAVTRAQRYLDKGDEWLWSLVTSQSLPRSYAVNQDLGSPVTGRDIFQYGNYPWLADPLNRPWKIVDPSSDYVFPTNDFAAYYASGLDEHGLFDPARADRSLLVNELYPERGPTWGVDDGFGWVDEDGNKWTFIAYYHHWHLWYSGTPTAEAAIAYALRSFRDAFLYTGDLTYAHAGLILLDRIADIYPAMDASAYKREDGYLQSDGLSGQGKILGCIWETSLAKDFITAYDAFFPAIATADDANVVPFLSAKAEQYGLPPKDSIEAIKTNIEDNILRVALEAVPRAQIRGNFGSHQATAAMAAVVLDSPTESKEWIDWVFQSGQYIPPDQITGGNVYATLVNDVDRDGFGNEASPGYNYGWISQLAGVADALADYDGYAGADLYQHPKYAQMIAALPALVMLNRYLPPIGDTLATGQPGLPGTAQQYTTYFERYGDPVFAQMAYLSNGESVEGLYSSVFAEVADTQERIAAIVEREGPLALPSVNLTGYGFAALRSGTGRHMRGIWTYYGRNRGHGHADALNLGMHGFGVDLLPDLGYPEFADNNARRHEWTANTVAHNTVVVDASKQQSHWVGQPHGFAATEDVQLFDIAAPEVYPQTSLYRRVSILVKVDEENSYVVDVFRVVGGQQHHFSFHAAEGPVTTDGLTLVPQETGSYAGPDIEPPPDNAPPRPDASGFDWLSNVSRDTAPPSTFSVDWSVKDTWNVHDPDPDLHVRLTMLTEVDEVALCDGIPPRNKPGNPASLRYVIARRAGENLASQFVSLVEPYVGQRYVREVTTVPIRAVNGTVADHEVAAVKVTLTNGRVDYIVSSLKTDVLLRVDDTFMFRGSVGVYSTRDGRVQYAFGHDASMVGPLPRMQGAPAVVGTVTDFTRELSSSNSLTLRLTEEGPAPDALVDSYVYVENDGVRNAVYRVVGARYDGPDTLVLDIGPTTTIRGYVDPNDFDKGYTYDVEVGQTARIPLTRQWRR